jgi:hypothetical protein
MPDVTCSHIRAYDRQTAARRECEECVKIGPRWDPSASISGVRRDVPLRRLT